MGSPMASAAQAAFSEALVYFGETLTFSLAKAVSTSSFDSGMGMLDTSTRWTTATAFTGIVQGVGAGSAEYQAAGLVDEEAIRVFAAASRTTLVPGALVTWNGKTWKVQTLEREESYVAFLGVSRRGQGHAG